MCFSKSSKRRSRYVGRHRISCHQRRAFRVSSKRAKKHRQRQRSKAKAKAQYRIRNWRAYNASLVQRGSLTVWIDEASLSCWLYEGPQHQGGCIIYSDLAVLCLLTLRALFRLPLRATQGLGESLFGLLGLTLPIPHYSTLCRRSEGLDVPLLASCSGPIDVVVDSTGLKVFGEGEWKVRKHGYSKRRKWRKLHLAVDPATNQIVAEELSEAKVDDAEMVLPLVEQVRQNVSIDSSPNASPMKSFCADGAYDQRKVYAALDGQAQQINIPPRQGARIWQHKNHSDPPLPRDENLRSIRKMSRTAWKKESGYHKRSLSETAIYRYKTQFGSKMQSKKIDNQKTEARLKCRILNQMTALGMPDSYKLAS